jgi:hypothetical protein
MTAADGATSTSGTKRNTIDLVTWQFCFSLCDDGRIKIRRDDKISYRVLTNLLMLMFDDA